MKGIIAVAPLVVASVAAFFAHRERPPSTSFKEAGALVEVRDAVASVEEVDPALDALVTRARRRTRRAASSELRLDERGPAPWQRARARRDGDRAALLGRPLGEGFER